MTEKTLAQRCLELTALFETSRRPPDCFGILAGGKDGQGTSFGAIQFTARSGNLGGLLRATHAADAAGFEAAFPHGMADELLTAAASPEAFMAWCASVQLPGKVMPLRWVTGFSLLGRLEHCQRLQVERAGDRFKKAVSWCKTLGLRSERSVAAIFDAIVQHGSLSPAMVKALSGVSDEQIRLEALAVVAAKQVKPEYSSRVRARRMLLAKGFGVRSGKPVDLHRDYGISLAPYDVA